MAAWNEHCESCGSSKSGAASSCFSVEEDWTALPGSLGSSKSRVEGHLFDAEKSTRTKDTKKTKTIRPLLSQALIEPFGIYFIISEVFAYVTRINMNYSAIKDAKGQQKMVEEVRPRISLINMLLITWPSWRWGNLFYSYFGWLTLIDAPWKIINLGPKIMEILIFERCIHGCPCIDVLRCHVYVKIHRPCVSRTLSATSSSSI